MTALPDEYRVNLVNNILFAPSHPDVELLVDAQMKEMQQNQPDSQFIAGFIDKIIADLQQFSPMHKGAQQWSNIRLAKILFMRIQRQYAVPVK
jgi:hypothetical protein